ncbi:MAG: hypothetical protein Q9190_006181 [Brigantiaea leucoxantha]
MKLGDILKKKEKIKNDTKQAQPSTVDSSPSNFTFMRTDTNTQELIQPPSFPEDYDSHPAKDHHHIFKHGPRLRSTSNASAASTASSRTDKRLSSRLRLGSRSRKSSTSSINVPTDLPPISDDTDNGEDREAQWENRATILAQENLAAKQTRSRGSSLASSGSHNRPAMVQRISDAQGDVKLICPKKEILLLADRGGIGKHSRSDQAP